MTALSKTPDNWWVSLTVPQKEHIASKLATKEYGKETHIPYIESSLWWNKCSEGKKRTIQEHCVKEHVFEGNKIQEGFSYSY